MLYLHKTPKILQYLYRERIWHIERGQKRIYLTFDDGPTEFQDELLMILKDNKVSASFFLVGENVKNNPERFSELISEGHSVGNHTFNHLNGWNASDEIYLSNIEKCQNIFRKNNYENYLFRPPYGKLKSSQARILRKKGFKIVMWDVLSGDFHTELSVEKCLKNTKKYTESGSIVVFHDNNKARKKVRELLPIYIDFFTSQGFKFAAL